MISYNHKGRRQSSMDMHKPGDYNAVGILKPNTPDPYLSVRSDYPPRPRVEVSS